jgi:hypothetical protein
MDMNAMGNGKWMTYAELGELIGGTPEAGRQIALRLRCCPIECDEHFTQTPFACRWCINNEISGMRDIPAKILPILGKRSSFNLDAVSSWLLSFGL